MQAITETRKITRLYFKNGNPRREGWSNYKCNICLKTLGCQIDRSEKSEYDNGYPILKQHLIEQHPEYCYRCEKCNVLHINKSDLISCKHNF